MKRKLKRWVKIILDSYLQGNLKIVYKILKKIVKNPEQFFMETSCRALSDADFNISFRLSPKEYDIEKQFLYQGMTDSFAIVMQGPIRTEETYTAKVAQYYMKLYPSALVVVSTWDDEPEDAIEAIRATGADVVLSPKPKYCGHLNLNYQIVNSCAGINYAVQHGAAYIAKTRTDQCVRKPHTFEYMLSLLHTFPSGCPDRQNARLICMSMNYGNLFYPYFMSDFFYFGSAEEMIRLFTIPLDEREKFSMPSGSSQRQYSDAMYAPEVFLMKNYLIRIGYEGDGSVRDYWEAVRNSLICIGMKDVDLEWPKYNGKYSLHSFFGDYFEDDTSERKKTVNFDFVNWLNLYTGVLKYSSETEKYADVVFK